MELGVRRIVAQIDGDSIGLERGGLVSLGGLPVVGAPGSEPDRELDRATTVAHRFLGYGLTGDRSGRPGSPERSDLVTKVRLIGEHGLQCRASVGPDRPTYAFESALDGETLLGAGRIVIPDLAAHPRFAHAPGVGADGMDSAFGRRFYAGIALRDPAGRALGTLTLLDGVPHEVGAAWIELFAGFAAGIEDEIVRARSIRRLGPTRATGAADGTADGTATEPVRLAA